jgi:succinylglutamate desuccinylase
VLFFFKKMKTDGAKTTAHWPPKRIFFTKQNMTNLTQLPRLIGTYEGPQRGPLMLVLAATHGNEPAGVHALQEVFRLLDLEPDTNPGFQFRGRLVGLRGNVQALATGQRFVEQDLNRLWQPDVVSSIMDAPAHERAHERRELAELLETIRTQITDYQPDTLAILDLHTTSADGGIFCIPLDGDAASLALARELHAPVVLGLLQGLGGTLLHFAAANGFAVEEWPRQTVSAAFEAGQHDDPQSVSRATAAVIHALRAVGCVRAADVDSRHEAVLSAFSSQLPTVVRISYVHHLSAGDGFRMRPGYVNFQPIRAGEHLADDASGRVLAPHDGRILMPLYQPKGSDGFFVVQEE